MQFLNIISKIKRFIWGKPMRNHNKFDNSIAKAKEVLESSGIDMPPIPVEEIIENYSLQLEFIDLKDKSRDISGLYDPSSQTIYVNANDTPARQRFTIAHEFGHALLHQKQLKENPNLGILYRRSLKDKIFDTFEEQEANRFAAYLLVPESIINKIYPTCKSTGLLAKIFNVSRQVIDFHIKNLGLKS